MLACGAPPPLWAQFAQLDTDLRPLVAPPPSAASDAAGALEPLPLQPSHQLAPPPRGPGKAALPMFLEADTLSGETDIGLHASGKVRLRRGGMTVRADRLDHTASDNTAHFIGNVRVDNLGNVYEGPEAKVQLDTSAGWFLSPTYRFARTGAGGRAERFDFIDEDHSRATRATYSSCTREDGAEPAWELTTSSVELDFEQDVGTAKDAVVRFYGVPILGAPSLTFPLSDARKSGWLPPSFDISDRSGFELEVPYYWNIAPNRDATLAPVYATRRGPGLNTEFRYLEPDFSGEWHADVMPHDQLADRERWRASVRHQHEIGSHTKAVLDLQRVSDDDYWKDYPRGVRGITPRLLGSRAALEQRLDTRALGLARIGTQQLDLFARVQDWQDLQTDDPTTNFVAPYRRAPQVGLAGFGDWGGLQWSLDTQVNRFTHVDPDLPTGTRWHALASMAYPVQPIPGVIGWTVTPRISLNAADYALDQRTAAGRRSISRAIPTFSLNSAWVLEKPGRWFGRDYVQTLEPRLQYLRTPFKDQADIPQFDSAPLDFNADSIYADNAFSGVDRVSDAHQVSAGLTARLIDPATGAEALRLGIVQRYLLSDQRITADGEPLTQRLSDLLLLGSTSVIPNWYLDSTLRYNADANLIERTTFTARYSPGAWRTAALTYRATRSQNRQIDIGWQWPIAGQVPLPGGGRALTPAAAVAAAANAGERPAGAASSAGCTRGTWYSVGRLNYNLLDNRITDSLLGIEYDGGCWIGRIVAERLSTGRAEATTRLMFQLELVGLSRLGASPLRSLRENIPGYRLLREDQSIIASPVESESFTPSDD